MIGGFKNGCVKKCNNDGRKRWEWKREEGGRNVVGGGGGKGHGKMSKYMERKCRFDGCILTYTLVYVLDTVASSIMFERPVEPSTTTNTTTSTEEGEEEVSTPVDSPSTEKGDEEVSARVDSPSTEKGDEEVSAPVDSPRRQWDKKEGQPLAAMLQAKTLQTATYAVTSNSKTEVTLH